MISINTSTTNTFQTNYKGFFFDLLIYISVMFLVRKVYFQELNFITNGLLWSFSTLAIATWRMKIRNISWKQLGLIKPKKLLKILLVTAGILAAIPIAIMIFQYLVDIFQLSLNLNSSPKKAISKFEQLKGNWTHFFTIIPFILIQSALEELLDRGFLIHWFENLFSKTNLNTLIAVVLQACIFGFRHSYDLSKRSITVGIIGLIMGIAYVKFGRNLWPLILAHCILNIISMIDRV